MKTKDTVTIETEKIVTMLSKAHGLAIMEDPETKNTIMSAINYIRNNHKHHLEEIGNPDHPVEYCTTCGQTFE